MSASPNPESTFYGHLPFLELGEGMQRRITAYNVDASEMRKQTCLLLTRLNEWPDKPLSRNECDRYAQQARARLLDPEASILYGGVRKTLYELVVSAHRALPLMQELLPQVADPNRRFVNGRHPLAAAAAVGLYRFKQLSADPRCDFSLGSSDENPLSTHLLALLTEANAKLSNIKTTYSKLPGNELQRAKQAVKRARGVIRYACALGIYIPGLATLSQEFTEGGIEYSHPPLKASIARWQQVMAGEHRITEIGEADLKQCAGLYHISRVFAPALWHGAEAQGLAMLSTFHPSLQREAAREAAVLQNAMPNPTPWLARMQAASHEAGSGR